MARVYTMSQKVVESRRLNGIQKGATAWNKGLKGQHVITGTEFQKGVHSWNTGRTTAIKITCDVCGKVRKVVLSKIRAKNYCSRECFFVSGRLQEGQTFSNTSIEIAVYEKLRGMAVDFIEQYSIGHKYRVDAFVPSRNLVIECDGDYWHSLPYALAKDPIKDKYLTERGYKVMRLPEHIINSGEYVSQLEEVLCG